MRTSPTINQACSHTPIAAAEAKRKWPGDYARTRCAASLSRRRDRSASAFTLTEILVVVALVGLLASASGNVAYNTYKRYLVEKAARQLYLAARYARLFAVEHHTQCRLVIDKATRRFFVMVERPGITAADDENSVRILANRYTRPTELAGTVEFEEVNVLSVWEGTIEGVRDGAAITFYPDGTADMAAIQLGDGLNHFAVYVSAATGKANIQFGLAAEAPIEIVDLDVEGLR